VHAGAGAQRAALETRVFHQADRLQPHRGSSVSGSNDVRQLLQQRQGQQQQERQRQQCRVATVEAAGSSSNTTAAAVAAATVAVAAAALCCSGSSKFTMDLLQLLFSLHRCLNGTPGTFLPPSAARQNRLGCQPAKLMPACSTDSPPPFLQRGSAGAAELLASRHYCGRGRKLASGAARPAAERGPAARPWRLQQLLPSKLPGHHSLHTLTQREGCIVCKL
jgi:hypothetical protein